MLYFSFGWYSPPESSFTHKSQVASAILTTMFSNCSKQIYMLKVSEALNFYLY